MKRVVMWSSLFNKRDKLLSCWQQQETAGDKPEEGEDTLIHYSRTLLLPPYTTLNLLFS
jgi:hypothetical protein